MWNYRHTEQLSVVVGPDSITGSRWRFCSLYWLTKKNSDGKNKCQIPWCCGNCWKCCDIKCRSYWPALVVIIILLKILWKDHLRFRQNILFWFWGGKMFTRRLKELLGKVTEEVADCSRGLMLNRCWVGKASVYAGTTPKRNSLTEAFEDFSKMQCLLGFSEEIRLLLPRAQPSWTFTSFHLRAIWLCTRVSVKVF